MSNNTAQQLNTQEVSSPHTQQTIQALASSGEWVSQRPSPLEKSKGEPMVIRVEKRQPKRAVRVKSLNMIMGAERRAEKLSAKEGKRQRQSEEGIEAPRLTIVGKKKFTVKQRITDSNVMNIFAVNTTLSEIVVDPQSQITAAGLAVILQIEPRLKSLSLSGCSSIFSSWIKLKGEDSSEFKKSVKAQKNAIKLISKHVSITKVDFAGLQFIDESAIFTVLENKMIKNINFSRCLCLNDKHLMKMSHVKILSANDCDLLTPVGFSKANLISMRRLRISRCSNLTLAALTPILAIPSLIELVISSNPQLNRGFHAFQGHKNLKILDISGIPITDADVSIIATIGLEELNLSNCTPLTGLSMENIALGRCAATLERLFVDSLPNVLSMRVVGRLTKIKRLSMLNSSKDAAMNLMLSIGSSQTLRELLISHFDDEMARLVSLSRLSSLVAEKGSLTNKGAQFLLLSPTLTEMTISGLEIDDDVMRNLTGVQMMNVFIMEILASKLEHRLLLDGCVILSPQCLNQLSTIDRLTEISLAGCLQIGDEFIAKMISQGVEALETLNLEGTNVTGACLAGIYSDKMNPVVIKAVVEKAGGLDLQADPNVTDESVFRILKIPKLEWLNVSSCKGVTGKTLYEMVSQRITVKMLALINTSITRFDCERVLQGVGRLDIILIRTIFSMGYFTLAELPNLSVDIALDLLKYAYIEKLDVSAVLPAIGQALFPLRISDTLLHLDVSEMAQMSNADIEYLFEGRMRLLSLNISGCTSISDEGLVSISKSTTLETLIMANVVSATDNSVASFSRIPTLTVLDIRGCVNVRNLSIRALSVSSLKQFLFGGSGVDKDCFNQRISVLPNPVVIYEFLRHFTSFSISYWEVPVVSIGEALARSKHISSVSITGSAFLNYSFVSRFIINQLPLLEYLDLSGCPSLEMITVGPRMKTLKVGGCWRLSNLDSKTVRAIFTSKLCVLSLRDVGFKCTDIVNKKSDELRELDVRGTEFTSVAIKRIPSCFKNLEILDLSKCSFGSGCVFPNLLELPFLKELYLDDNTVVDVDIEAIRVAYTAGWTQRLKILSLNSCPITAASIPLLKEFFENLEILSLRKTNVGQEIQPRIFGKWNIKKVDLSGSYMLTEKHVSEFILVQLRANKEELTEYILEECPRITTSYEEIRDQAKIEHGSREAERI